MADIKIIGLQELKQAIRRNPQLVVNEVSKFLVRGRAVYFKNSMSTTWRVGMSGGGAPEGKGRKGKKGGNLRQRHRNLSESKWHIAYGVDKKEVPYAEYVHDGTSKMAPRPWLDYTFDTSARQIEKLQEQLLEAITRDLAK
jgi:HK97 gp10 family phage protein